MLSMLIAILCSDIKSIIYLWYLNPLYIDSYYEDIRLHNLIQKSSRKLNLLYDKVYIHIKEH